MPISRGHMFASVDRRMGTRRLSYVHVFYKLIIRVRSDSSSLVIRTFTSLRITYEYVLLVNCQNVDLCVKNTLARLRHNVMNADLFVS